MGSRIGSTKLTCSFAICSQSSIARIKSSSIAMDTKKSTSKFTPEVLKLAAMSPKDEQFQYISGNCKERRDFGGQSWQRLDPIELENMKDMIKPELSTLPAAKKNCSEANSTPAAEERMPPP
jgi:hypothetical protein